MEGRGWNIANRRGRRRAFRNTIYKIWQLIFAVHLLIHSPLGKTRKDTITALVILCNDVLILLRHLDTHYVLLTEPIDLDKVDICVLVCVLYIYWERERERKKERERKRKKEQGWQTEAWVKDSLHDLFFGGKKRVAKVVIYTCNSPPPHTQITHKRCLTYTTIPCRPVLSMSHVMIIESF